MKKWSDEYFMREAIKEAKKAIKTGDWPIGCVVVHNGKIISRAHNLGYSTGNRTAHAELIAIQQAHRLLKKHVHEVTVYTTFDPCPMCVGAMLVMKVKRIVTGINPDRSGGLEILSHLSPFYHKEKFSISITNRVLVKESQEVFLRGKPTKEHMDLYDFTLDTR